MTKGDVAWRLQRDQANNGIECGCTNVNVEGTKYGQLCGTTSVNDGQWHHVVGAYDGSKMYVYVDGVLDVSSNASGRIYVSDYPVFIGANWQVAGREWNGLIDDVRIYNFGLTAEQIKAVCRGEDPAAQQPAR